jgi:hypothetical protein
MLSTIDYPTGQVNVGQCTAKQEEAGAETPTRGKVVQGRKGARKRKENARRDAETQREDSALIGFFLRFCVFTQAIL